MPTYIQKVSFYNKAVPWTSITKKNELQVNFSHKFLWIEELLKS